MAETGSTQQALDTTINRDVVSVQAPARQMVLTSYQRSALDIDEYAALAIAFAQSGEEVSRKEGVNRRVQVLLDAWGPLLKGAMENWITPRVADAVMGKERDQVDRSRNPAKHIWEELAALYRLPAQRTTPKRKADVQAYLQLLEGSGFDLFWRRAELLLQACNEVIIWPTVIEKKDRKGKVIKKLKHRMAVGNTVSLIACDADQTEVECVVIEDKYYDLTGVYHERYILWTDEWHAVYEGIDGGDMERVGKVEVGAEEDSSVANPYGEMPFVLIRLKDWDQMIWDQTTGEDLMDLTVHGGKERLFYRYMQKMGGFKQLAAVGNSEDQIPQQLMDPGELLKIMGDSLTVIDWQVDLKARLECMNMDELSAAASRGINPQRYKQSGDYQTGAAAERADRGLIERRSAAALIFGPAEAEYKRKVISVAKAYNYRPPGAPTGWKMPDPDILLEVKHAPIEYPESPKDQTDLDKTRISLGLDSAVSVMMREHPGWTEEQAKAEIRKNLENTALVNDMKVVHNIADDPETESRSAEENGRLGGRPPLNRNDTEPPGDVVPPIPRRPEETT